MCGIAGYISKDRIESHSVNSTLDLMSNRGPNNKGYKEFDSKSLGHIALLHSRLSIIDIDERSNQPFNIQGCHLIYNGEIYNYLELRKSLVKKGISLKTESDTEVLLWYYIIYGEKCVEYFEGMWSFVIYDSRSETVMFSRDRFGEKPFYYYQSNEGIYFGSEIKFIKQLCLDKLEINYNHIKRYIVNGHKSLYKTKEQFYKKVLELDIATNKIINSTGSIDKKYWQPEYNPMASMTINDAIDGTKERLIKSVGLRLRSDVPLAFCLSGGVDSASLVSIAAKKYNFDVNTFTIIDEDSRYNELDNVSATIKDIGCKNTMITLSNKENNLEKLKDLVHYHDAPVATLAYYVHSLLSDKIAKHGYKISISGTGADELFTGYYDHFNLHFYEMRKHVDFATIKKDWETQQLQFIRHPSFRQYNLYFKDPSIRDHIYLNNDIFSSYLTESFEEQFTETNYTKSSLLRNRMMNEMFSEVVRVILHEDDLNSMKYSVENRSPFLDKSLFDFAYTIPNEHLIKNGYAKYLLRESMNGILNDKVRLSREKKGFNASINSIIDFENKNHIDYILSNSKIFDFVNKDKIARLLKQKNYTNSFKKFLFNFINAKIFLDAN